MLVNFLLVAVGGALGSACRYGFSLLLTPVGGSLPWGTMAANLLGSLIIGFVTELAVIKAEMPPEMRLLLATGFCGGLTTLSSLVFEANSLLRDREFLGALVYAGLTLILAFAALWTGMLLCRWIFIRN